jgi:hypothetical protein
VANDLASPADLAGLPGAPFTDAQVDAAVQAVRNAAGWHIAPEREETVVLDVVCAELRLRLPTRKLVSVDEIRDADSDDVIAADTYRVSRALAQVKRNSAWWTSGFEAVEVDMTHGHTTCPADVLAVITNAIGLARRDPTVQRVSLDDFATSYVTDATRNAIRAQLEDYALEDSLYGLGVA